MKVCELIEELKKFDQNLEVVYIYDGTNDRLEDPLEEIDEYEWNFDTTIPIAPCRYDDRWQPTGKKVVKIGGR